MLVCLEYLFNFASEKIVSVLIIFPRGISLRECTKSIEAVFDLGKRHLN